MIEQYLNGELSVADRIVFEQRMANNPELKAEVEVQKDIHEGAKRAFQKANIQQIGKKYHYSKLLKWGTLSLSVIALLLASTLFLTPNQNSESSTSVSTELSEDVIPKIEAEDLIDNLKTQFLSVSGEGSVVLSEDGILISAQKGSFTKDGQVYNGDAIIKLQEALDPADIVKSGLSTMSGDRLLETQGMFSFDAFTPDGERLEVNPEIGVYVQVPVDEYKKGMQLFDGVKDSSGMIDWVNPEPLEKLPILANMEDLDFYPVDFEPYLDKEKWSQKKRKRDSLYLSFEERFSVEEKPIANTNTSRAIAMPIRKLHPDENKYLYPGNPPIDNDMTYEEAHRLSQWVEGPNYHQFQSLRENTISDSTSVESVTSDIAIQYKFIPPSKVLAFWKKKFNNTTLSTRDFEKRMRAIHATCNPAVLRKYTRNIHKSIAQIDREVVAIGYSNFQSFADENVGSVKQSNVHLRALAKFYEDGISALKKEAKHGQDKEEKRRNKFDNEIQDERNKETTRTTKRNSEALVEEFNFNMRNVKKQIGRVVGMTIRHSPQGVIKNIDAYVWNATATRTSLDMLDPLTGKRVKITYNDFSFAVPNSEKYIKLFAYVFPHQLNSYQRISGKAGKFEYPLNDDILYDIGIVGITADGYEYYQKQTFKSGELGEIDMYKITEKQMDASIRQLNKKRIKKPMNIRSELKWLMKERANYTEQRQRKEMRKFREEIKQEIFPCYTGIETEVAVPFSGQGIDFQK